MTSAHVMISTIKDDVAFLLDTSWTKYAKINPNLYPATKKKIEQFFRTQLKVKKVVYGHDNKGYGPLRQYPNSCAFICLYASILISCGIRKILHLSEPLLREFICHFMQFPFKLQVDKACAQN